MQRYDLESEQCARWGKDEARYITGAFGSHRGTFRSMFVGHFERHAGMHMKNASNTQPHVVFGSGKNVPADFSKVYFSV